MHRYFIHLAFDGTDYHGWQVQPNGITIQQVLEETLSTQLNQEIRVTGAGRTDAGVHASYFVAHFDTAHSIDGNHERFLFRINRFLPADIVVYRIEEVDLSLHARFSALYRTYQYHISTVKPLFTRNYALHIHGPLDLDEIRKCCQLICEADDFTSFSKLHSDVKTYVCNVMHAEWSTQEKGYLFEIRADRFLRNMVRALVGTLLNVGRGKLDTPGFKRILDAKDRRLAGQSAPAHGLFLVDIGFDFSKR